MSTANVELDRYRTAQDQGEPSRLEQALAELRSGCKRGHWIWFVLPQLACLGRSAKAQYYGIANLTEARAYLADPQLRQRLDDVISIIAEQLGKPSQSLADLMGGQLDAAKTISCLTLFEAAGLQSASALLDQLGGRCPLTLAALTGNTAPAARPWPSVGIKPFVQ